MSIINDALKKAQQSLEKKQHKTPIENVYEKLSKPQEPLAPHSALSSPASISGVTSSDEPKAWYTNIFFLTSIFLIVIGFLTAILIFLSNQSSIKIKHLFIQPVDSQGSVKPPPPSAVKRTYNKDELVLSGIVMMGDQRVALINDAMYELGEKVQGKQIINITMDKVEILDGERILVLEVHKKD